MEVGHAGAVAAGVNGDGGDGVVDAVDDEVAGAALADLKTEEIKKILIYEEKVPVPGNFFKRQQSFDLCM